MHQRKLVGFGRRFVGEGEYSYLDVPVAMAGHVDGDSGSCCEKDHLFQSLDCLSNGEPQDTLFLKV